MVRFDQLPAAALKNELALISAKWLPEKELGLDSIEQQKLSLGCGLNAGVS